jgi:hypothetical protein
MIELVSGLSRVLYRRKKKLQIFGTYTHTLKGSLGSDVRVILNVTFDLKQYTRTENYVHM